MKTGPKPKTKKEALQLAMEKATKLDECLLVEWGRTVGYGYKMISCEGTQYFAHRLAYELTKGPVNNLVIRHTCDRPNCINPDHLLAGTHGDNVKDKVNRNRQSRGWKHYNSKLTEKAVEELRALKKPNFKELADQYMMSVGALKSAYYGHTWKHVPLREEIQTRAQETLTYVTSEAYVSSRDADDVSESGGSTDAKNEED